MVATGGQTGKGIRVAKKKMYEMHGNNVLSAKVSGVSLLRVGTVLRLERDASSMVK